MFQRMHQSTLLILALSALSGPLVAQQTSSTDDPIARIRDEGLNHSQVAQTLTYLSDVIGPRLTGSPSLKRANEWTRDKMTGWGLQNAHLEAWGPFGRGWSLERFSAQVVSPQDIPLIAFPKAWSPGLKGTYTGEVVYVDAKDEVGLEKYKGHLKGAIVLNGPMHDVKAKFEAPARRWTDAQLEEMANAEPRQRGGGGRRNFQVTPEQRARLQFSGRLMKFYQEEGAALVVEPSPRGDSGTIFVQSATVPALPPASGTGTPAPASGTGAIPPPAAASGAAPPAGGPGGGPGGPGGGLGRRVGPWEKTAPKILPQIVVADEQYNRLLRMLDAGEKLKMAVELDVKFYDQDPMAYNTIAEIPGSDLKDQIVMLGGHMDSWHSGTGATDNGAGVAVCMEAVRILKTLNLQPRRTIRIALWSGEEEGLYGSRAYVTEHFGSRNSPSTGGFAGGGPPVDPASLVRKPEYDKLDAYFNLDNGTGKIRGIYLQGNEALRPIFREWLAPFKDLGASTVTINNTGSTDHISFDSIGLPGFEFIQDPIDYDALTHHSNEDVYDHAQIDDLKEASVIMAAFIYNTAMRDEPLPRKPTAQSAAR